jgi:hypothetical protein
MIFLIILSGSIWYLIVSSIGLVNWDPFDLLGDTTPYNNLNQSSVVVGYFVDAFFLPMLCCMTFYYVCMRNTLN